MRKKKETLRIGGGSACPGDRLEPAVELIEKGDIDYIVFDSLSESEMLAFERHKLTHPDEGFDLYTERRLRTILPLCARHGVKIVGNMGGANPLACQEFALRIARELGLRGYRIGVVVGDNALPTVKKVDPIVREIGKPASTFGDRLIAANAYIPCDDIVGALDEDADLVITGRVGDASLFLAPMRYEFGWKDNDWDLLAKGIVVGHLLECAGQLTGGYYPDPPYKVVPDLWKLGFPITEMKANGDVVITKVEGSGGLVNRFTCAEQMLYETGDPANYIEADVITDFSDIDFTEIGPNQVVISGTVKGKPKPDNLKVNLGVREGFRAGGTIYYAGPGAYERAKLAAETMKLRLERVTNFKGTALHFDYIGINAIYGPPEEQVKKIPWDVGVRMSCRADSREEAWKIMHELETIDNNGPAAIARGLRSEEVVETLGYYMTFVPRENIKTSYQVKEA